MRTWANIHSFNIYCSPATNSTSSNQKEEEEATCICHETLINIVVLKWRQAAFFTRCFQNNNSIEVYIQFMHFLVECVGGQHVKARPPGTTSPWFTRAKFSLSTTHSVVVGKEAFLCMAYADWDADGYDNTFPMRALSHQHMRMRTTHIIKRQWQKSSTSAHLSSNFGYISEALALSLQGWPCVGNKYARGRGISFAASATMWVRQSHTGNVGRTGIGWGKAVTAWRPN